MSRLSNPRGTQRSGMVIRASTVRTAITAVTLISTLYLLLSLTSFITEPNPSQNHSTKPVKEVNKVRQTAKLTPKPTKNNEAKESNTERKAAKLPLSKPVQLEIFYSSDKCILGENVTTVQAYLNQPPAEVRFDRGMPKSLRVVGQGELQLFLRDGRYVASVVQLEGCLQVFPNPEFHRGELIPGAKPRQVDPALQRKVSTASDLTKPHTRIVFSCESAEYFGYQTTTNAYAFLQSNQTEASWLRLLTCHQPDDLAASLPTFTAPRSLYSRRYVAYNKPDIIDKWFQSEDAPHPDDTIVVIDPDNWLLKDVHEWTSKVSKKHAYGQAAYYHTNKKVQQLWKEVCKAGCDNTVDTVGVPYVLKASDMKEVAPLWREYTILLKELMMKDKESFEKEYNSLYMSWTSEMYGYNFACAHLSIKTTVVWDLQIRDVDPSEHMSKQNLAKKSMIHMGRAWFPDKHAALAEKWRHTEGKDFRQFGIQVWCKCNVTGSTIMPWPIPNGLNFQSYHTLRLLHEAKEWFGPIPKNETLRPSNGASIP